MIYNVIPPDFEKRIAIGPPLGATGGVQSADFDGDGHEDCAIGLGKLGLGWFYSPHTIAGGPDPVGGCDVTGGLAVADFNGDGKPDVAAGGDGVVCVFLNQM